MKGLEIQLPATEACSSDRTEFRLIAAFRCTTTIGIENGPGV
jgi:hypothetical protein